MQYLMSQPFQLSVTVPRVVPEGQLLTVTAVAP